MRGVRLSLAIQIQEAALREFLYRSGNLARGIGFFARFLIGWPESMQGTRMYSEAPAEWPALTKFDRRIREILSQDLPVNDDGTLNPTALILENAAKSGWTVFHNAIEKQLASGGDLHDIRDAASKAADNVVRMAALFHIFSGAGNSPIKLEFIESASRIVSWHLNESRRFFGQLALPPEMYNAAQLDTWLLKYARKHGIKELSRRFIQRNVSPHRLRHRAAFEAAMAVLIDAGRIILDEETKVILINPSLIGG